MLSVIVLRNAEPTVIQMTMEGLQKDLNSINGAELLVDDDWRKGAERATHNLICLVESDCLVNSGYFSSMVGLFNKNKYYRQLVMLGSAIGINTWAPKYYGYRLDKAWSEPDKRSKIQTARYEIAAIPHEKSKEPYPIDFCYVPGAIIRKNAFLSVTKDNNLFSRRLVPQKLKEMSVELCKGFSGTDRHIFINPSTTYVTTEDVVHD